jgi:uncharacterized protein with HEPN domain
LPLRTRDFLVHISTALQRILRYVDDVDEATFLRDQQLQDAVIHNLTVIGEACRSIEVHDPLFAAAHPRLPLRAAYAIRNALVHSYYLIDLEILWRTVRDDLPGLQAMVRALIEAPTKNERD